MLPGYVAPDLLVTRHIHLGIPGGSGYGAHGEPPYTFKSIRDRMSVPEYQISVAKAWDGTPFDSVLEDSSSNPIVYENFEYVLRVSLNDYDLLRHLIGRRLNFIDVWHCADDQDHTPFIRLMLFSGLEYANFDDPLLTHNNVKASFTDLQTVAPLT